jgi:hypothetical protein
MSATTDRPVIGEQPDSINRKLMDGLATVPAFAEGVNKTTRTVGLYIRDGMPVIYIGRTPYPIVDRALAWLKARGERDLAPRRVGRPKKAIATPPRNRPSKESAPAARSAAMEARRLLDGNWDGTAP